MLGWVENVAPVYLDFAREQPNLQFFIDRFPVNLVSVFLSCFHGC